MGKKHQARKAQGKKAIAKAGKAAGRKGGGVGKKSIKGSKGALKKKAQRKNKRVEAAGRGDTSSDEGSGDERRAPGASGKQKKADRLCDCYSPNERTLLVGEGNFSFAAALVSNFGGNGANLVATAYDSEAEAVEKYADVGGIVTALEGAGVGVRWGVDARRLKQALKLGKRRSDAAPGTEAWRFAKVVFNFPHAGAGIKDQDRNVRVNQELLGGFFLSALEVVRPGGEVHVTVKTGKPYDLWGVVSLAHRVSGGRLVLHSSYRFRPDQFPGYSHRRTIGHREGLSASGNEEILASSPRTYVWTVVAA